MKQRMEWQPISEGTEINVSATGLGSGVATVRATDEGLWLEIFVGDEDDTTPVLLPYLDGHGYAFCHRAPAPDAGVPMGIQETLNTALRYARMELYALVDQAGAARFRVKIDEALAWLNNQPQPGQEAIE